MSRIGRLPITVPGGVDVALDGNDVTVKGPKGSLSHKIANPIKVERGDDGVTLTVTRPDDERASRSLHGPHPHPDRQHGDRRDPGVREEA
jgi:large subunit ribosomal protein L6